MNVRAKICSNVHTYVIIIDKKIHRKCKWTILTIPVLYRYPVICVNFNQYFSPFFSNLLFKRVIYFITMASGIFKIFRLKEKKGLLIFYYCCGFLERQIVNKTFVVIFFGFSLCSIVLLLLVACPFIQILYFLAFSKLIVTFDLLCL